MLGYLLILDIHYLKWALSWFDKRRLGSKFMQ